MNPASPSRWFHSSWFVLVMLFFVLGPLGLPLLWKSPRFTPWAKVMLTVAVLLYTVWLLQLSGAIIQKSLDQLQPVIR